MPEDDDRAERGQVSDEGQEDKEGETPSFLRQPAEGCLEPVFLNRRRAHEIK